MKTYFCPVRENFKFELGFVTAFCALKKIEWKEETGFSNGGKFSFVAFADLSSELDFLARNGIEAWVEKN
jgi:hypothetical protein